MPVVFSANTGRVFAVEDKVAAGSFSLGNISNSGQEGEPITFQKHNTIITRIGLAAAGNYQFLHTIGNDVYVYVFGDRMGQVRLHGLSFQTACPPPGSSDTQALLQGASGEKHGFELLFDWYTKYRIAAIKNPVRVTIGRETNFDGFVTALTGDVQDALHRTIQFQMTISLLPDVIAGGA